MKIHCLYDELAPVGALKPHPKNRNQHPKEQLERLGKILEYQGWRYAVKVSKLSGFITSGHGRLEAAKLKGWEQVPVVYQEYDDEAQEYADVQADNAIASWAELDLSEINTDIGSLGPEFDIDLLGIKNFQIDVADRETDAEAGELPGTPKSVLGDLWHCGSHRVLCGDATLIDHVSKLMGDDRADCVWTDPPYNVAYEGKTEDALTIQNDSMGDQDFYEFLRQSFSNMLTSTKPGGAIYIAHADTEGVNFRRAMMDSGWLFKQCLIWKKQQFVMGRQDYHWKHEPILYGWAPGAAHQWFGDRRQSTVLEFDRPSRSASHPTMKPLDLIEYCLANSAPRGGSVLDLFGGSGSTLMACVRTNRRAFVNELDPRYVDVILNRYAEATKDDPIRADGVRWSQLVNESTAVESTG